MDCAGEKAEVIEKARKLKSIKTTLALGETASIDGADYSLIGLMKCADPDPEEPSQWIEYLMFNPAQGFLWLVETDEGLGARQGLRYLAQPGQCVHRALAVAPVPQAVRLHVASGSGAGRVQLARQVGDSTQITDYQTGNFKLTREQGEAELGWSASSPVSGRNWPNGSSGRSWRR